MIWELLESLITIIVDGSLGAVGGTLIKTIAAYHVLDARHVVGVIDMSILEHWVYIQLLSVSHVAFLNEIFLPITRESLKQIFLR